MALNSLFIQVTNTTAGVIYLADINQGFERESASRSVRPGPVYIPANGSVELALSSTVLLSYESGNLRTQVVGGNLTVSQMGGVAQALTWEYDFAALGGAISTIPLVDIQGLAKTLPPSLMLRGWVEIVTLATSGGAPTLTLGTVADPDGFLVSVNPTTLAANVVVPFDGALVHNGTALVDSAQTKNSTSESMVAVIGTATVTAGRFRVHLEILPVFA